MPLPPDAQAAGHSRQGRPEPADEATVYLTDIYWAGPEGRAARDGQEAAALRTALRLSRHGRPHQHRHRRPWDVQRILGTVPVEADGSASFQVPANTPLAVQPLDAEGKALQVMRSWFTAMPGENAVLRRLPRARRTRTPPPKADAGARAASRREITPWYGPARGFSFTREVQPVLDKYCVGCHNPEPTAAARPDAPRPGTRLARLHAVLHRPAPVRAAARSGKRLPPAEAAGVPRQHQRTGPDAGEGPPQREARRRGLGPADHLDRPERAGPRHLERTPRRALADGAAAAAQCGPRYANRPEDPEADSATRSSSRSRRVDADAAAGAASARPGLPPAGRSTPPRPRRRQKALQRCRPSVKIELSERRRAGPGADPRRRVRHGRRRRARPTSTRPAWSTIDKPFYMGECEVTNAQYALFDPEHDSGVHQHDQQGPEHRGEPVNRPNAAGGPGHLATGDGVLPVAVARDRPQVSACRPRPSGSTPAAPARPRRSPTADCDADFRKFANLADATRAASSARGDSPKWHPARRAVQRRGDGHASTSAATSPTPGACATCTATWPSGRARRTGRTPTTRGDGRDDPRTAGKKVVRGGSWYDRPQRARSAFRLPLPAVAARLQRRLPRGDGSGVGREYGRARPKMG